MGSPPSKNASLINNYAHQLRSALSELNCTAPEAEIESVVVFLLRTMGSDLRDYHKPEHSIDVSLGQPPIARIAALFHDCVYVQVDPNWKNSLSEVLQTLMPSETFILNVKDSLEKPGVHAWFKTVATVFNCEDETSLQPAGGLNEFLSALVLVRKMEKLLKPIDLLKAVACIEATIPFRKVDSKGNSPSQRLRERLPVAAKQLSIDLTEIDTHHASQLCRGIVESDLAGFGSERLNFFLSNTWNVMNENSAALRNSFFLVSDYRKAVCGNIGFLQSLNPDHMFWSDVANGPGSQACEKNARYVERARYNLEYGVEYLKAVGLSLSVVEAVALETGGDAPFEFFVGSLKKSREHKPLEIGKFLNLDFHPVFDADSKKDVYLILKDGREMRAKFDRKYSPLGAFLYAHLQASGQFENFFQASCAFHKGQGSPRDFLNRLPREMKSEIFSSISQLATTRSHKIDLLRN